MQSLKFFPREKTVWQKWQAENSRTTSQTAGSIHYNGKKELKVFRELESNTLLLLALIHKSLIMNGAGEENRIMAAIFHNLLNCSLTLHSELSDLDISASKGTAMTER